MRNRTRVGAAALGAAVLFAAVAFGLKVAYDRDRPERSESPPAGAIGAGGATGQEASPEGVEVGRDGMRGWNSGETTEEASTHPQGQDRDSHETTRPTFVRAEDAGEDLALLGSSEVLRRLTQSSDRIVQIKAAKVLGDRDLAGTLRLSREERAAVDEYADRQVALTAGATGQERADANDQIRRLWRLAADRLIQALGSDNRTIVEAAVRNLALMRNGDLVAKIIARIKASDDARFKRGAILALGMMREKRDCLVPGRTTLGDAESEVLASKVIVPFLKDLQAKEKDPETLAMIRAAFHFLDNPPDARLRPTEGASGPGTEVKAR